MTETPAEPLSAAEEAIRQAFRSVWIEYVASPEGGADETDAAIASALRVAEERASTALRAASRESAGAGLDAELLAEAVKGSWMRQWVPFPTTQIMFAQSLAVEYARLAAARLPVEGENHAD